jgi:hypothetical protein
MTKKIWYCKIGAVASILPGSDSPMRDARKENLDLVCLHLGRLLLEPCNEYPEHIRDIVNQAKATSFEVYRGDEIMESLYERAKELDSALIDFEQSC